MGVKVPNAERELILKNAGYTEETFREDMERLRLWMKGQPHFPPSAREEREIVLMAFLLGCKGKMEKIKRKIDKYYSSRGKLMNFIYPLDPLDPRIMVAQQNGYFATMPEVTPEGDGITIGVLNRPEIEHYNFPTILKRAFMNYELRTMKGITSGEWLIIDAKNVTLAHVFATPLNMLKDFVEFIQDVSPVRIKGFIYINVPPSLKSIVDTFIKPLLNKKMAGRIFAYDDGGESLQNHFPKELLPVDYGGNAPPMKELSDAWYEECKANRDFLLGPVSEICDESKRLEKENSEYVHGTFRQLTID